MGLLLGILASGDKSPNLLVSPQFVFIRPPNRIAPNVLVIQHAVDDRPRFVIATILAFVDNDAAKHDARLLLGLQTEIGRP